MQQANGTLNPPDPTVIEGALSRVLGSPVFAQAQRQSRLLRYIVEESAAGRGGRLSQFSIGIDVFDRGADFDPTTDSAVRVEVGRLRAKLREYYETNVDEPVVFRLPKGRYVADIAVANDVGAAISASRDESTRRHPALVVLPFENFGGDPADDYFADGITDDLITDMSKLSGLKVIAHNSAFTYKGRKPTAAQLGAELGVTHVLEGSVRRAGKRVRINAQLVECAGGGHVWADRFDRELTDIFALQDEVGRHIVNALSLALTATDRYRFFDRGTENLEAYDYVLRASRLDFSRSEIERAYGLLQRAVDLDPEYGIAQARIALNRWYAAFCGWADDLAVREAVDAAGRAVELDPDNSDVQSIYSFVNFWHGSMAVADAAGDRSVTLDPTNVRALERRAICLVYLDRCDEAQDYIARAKVLNPHEPYYYPRGLVEFMRGNTAQAVELFSASAARFPSFLPTRIFLASSYILSADPARAHAQITAIRELSPGADFERLRARWENFPAPAVKRLAGSFNKAWEGESGGVGSLPEG